MYRFGVETTLHGFRDLLNPVQSPAIRTAWLLIMIGSIVCMSFMIYSNYKQFNANAIQTSIEYRSSRMPQEGIELMLCPRHWLNATKALELGLSPLLMNYLQYNVMYDDPNRYIENRTVVLDAVQQLADVLKQKSIDFQALLIELMNDVRIRYNDETFEVLIRTPMQHNHSVCNSITPKPIDFHEPISFTHIKFVYYYDSLVRGRGSNGTKNVCPIPFTVEGPWSVPVGPFLSPGAKTHRFSVRLPIVSARKAVFSKFHRFQASLCRQMQNSLKSVLVFLQTFTTRKNAVMFYFLAPVRP